MKKINEIPMTLDSWKPSRENGGDDKLGAPIAYLTFIGDVGEKTLAQFFESKEAYKQFEATVWDENEDLKNDVEKITLSSQIIGGSAQIYTEATREKPMEWDRVNLDSVTMSPSPGRVATLKFRLRVHATGQQIAKLYEQQDFEFRVSAQRPTAAQEREMAKEKEKQGNLSLPRPKEDDGKLSKADAEAILDGKKGPAKEGDSSKGGRQRRKPAELH